MPYHKTIQTHCKYTLNFSTYIKCYCVKQYESFLFMMIHHHVALVVSMRICRQNLQTILCEFLFSMLETISYQLNAVQSLLISPWSPVLMPTLPSLVIAVMNAPLKSPGFWAKSKTVCCEAGLVNST